MSLSSIFYCPQQRLQRCCYCFLPNSTQTCCFQRMKHIIYPTCHLWHHNTHLVDFVNEKSSSNHNTEYCHSEISSQDMSDATYLIHYEKNATGRTIRQHTIPYHIENGNHFRILPTSIYPKRDDLHLGISPHIRELCDTTFQVIFFVGTWKQILKELIAGALLTSYLHKKETSLESPLYALGCFHCARFIYHPSNALQSQLLYMHSLLLHYISSQSPLDPFILISNHPQNISLESNIGALVTEKVMNYKSFIYFVCNDKEFCAAVPPSTELSTMETST